MSKREALLRLLAVAPATVRALSQLARDMPARDALLVPYCMGAAPVGPRAIIERLLALDDEDADGLFLFAHLLPLGCPYPLPGGGSVMPTSCFAATTTACWSWRKLSVLWRACS